MATKFPEKIILVKISIMHEIYLQYNYYNYITIIHK